MTAVSEEIVDEPGHRHYSYVKYLLWELTYPGGRYVPRLPRYVDVGPPPPGEGPGLGGGGHIRGRRYDGEEILF